MISQLSACRHTVRDTRRESRGENQTFCFVCGMSYFRPVTNLTVKIPAELKASVEERARMTGRSVSAVVRESLRETIRPAQSGGLPSLLERAGDLCGCFDSGMEDLASNPKHLEGFGK